MIVAQFDFSINCNKEQAEELLSLILAFAEEHGVEVGGGFHLEEEAADDEES